MIGICDMIGQVLYRHQPTGSHRFCLSLIKLYLSTIYAVAARNFVFSRRVWKPSCFRSQGDLSWEIKIIRKL